MKTRILITSFVLFFFNNLLQAQNDTIRYFNKSEKEIVKSPPLNKIYFEILGSGFGLSANYERNIWHDDMVTINARVGIGSAVIFNALPILGFNACLGKEQSKFEVGLNALQVYRINFSSLDFYTTIYANPTIGYRYESKEGFLFRFTLTPIINPNSNEDFTFFPWLGISFGGTF
jgi:hypothetical protein